MFKPITNVFYRHVIILQWNLLWLFIWAPPCRTHFPDINLNTVWVCFTFVTTPDTITGAFGGLKREKERINTTLVHYNIKQWKSVQVMEYLQYFVNV